MHPRRRPPPRPRATPPPAPFPFPVRPRCRIPPLPRATPPPAPSPAYLRVFPGDDPALCASCRRRRPAALMAPSTPRRRRRPGPHPAPPGAPASTPRRRRGPRLHAVQPGALTPIPSTGCTPSSPPPTASYLPFPRDPRAGCLPCAPAPASLPRRRAPDAYLDARLPRSPAWWTPTSSYALIPARLDSDGRNSGPPRSLV